MDAQLQPQYAALYKSALGNLSKPSPAGASSTTQFDPAFQKLWDSANETSTPPVNPQPAKQAARGRFWATAPFAPVDAALGIGSGLIGQVAGGLAGLGDMGLKAFYHDAPAPANVVNNVERALTYTPTTPLGKDLENGVSWPFRKLAQGADWAGQKASNATGSPLVGAAVNTAIQALPMALGAKAGDAAIPEAEPLSPVAPEVAAAREAGLKLTPTQAQAEGGSVGRAVESLSGSAKLERLVSRANAKTVTDQIGKQIGIQGPVTAESLEAAKVPHNAVYDEVSKLGRIPTDDAYRASIVQLSPPGGDSFAFDTPPAIAQLRQSYGSLPEFDAKDAVDKVRQLRRDASANIGARYNPEQQALGFAQKHIANALEGQLQRHIQNVVTSTPAGETPSIDPSLMNRFAEARQKLAQINSVQKAFKAAKGEGISALNLAKQLDHNTPMVGPMRTIAEAAQRFPRAFQDMSKIRDSGPFSNLDWKLEGGLGALSPLAAIKTFPLLATPIGLRALLGSDLYQHMAFDPRLPTSPMMQGIGATMPFMSGDPRQIPRQPLQMLAP